MAPVEGTLGGMEISANTTASALLISRKASTALGALILHQNDSFTLSLYLCKETGNVAAPITVISLPTGYTRIALGARSADNLAEAGLLFSATAFTPVGSGQTLHYDALVSLNTAAITAKFPDSDTTKATLAVLLDIELRNEDASQILTVVSQARATIHRDIYRPDEGIPASGDPAYPLASALMLRAPADAGYRFTADNLFQLWNPTQGIYQTVFLTGAAGAESIVIAAS